MWTDDSCSILKKKKKKNQTQTQKYSSYLSLHVQEMQALGVDPHKDTDDIVVAGAGLGEHPAGEECGTAGGDVPAVL